MTEAFALHEIILDEKGNPIDYRFLEANPAFEAITGLKPSEIIGKTVSQVLPGTESYWIETYGKVALTGVPLTFTNRSEPLGKWYEVFSYAPRHGFFATIFTDVSLRKKAEEDLERYGLLGQNSRDIILFVDLAKGCIIEANAAAEKAYGYTREELHGKQIQDLRTPEEQELVPAQMSAADEGGILFETVHRRRDGTNFPVEVSSRGVTLGGRRTLVSIIRDISERKQVQAAFDKIEEKLRLHTENSPLAIIEWDQDFIITRWTGAAEAMFGWKAYETLGKPITDLKLTYAPDTPIFDATMARLAREAGKVVSTKRNVTKDGRVIWCTWYHSVLADPSGKMLSVMSEVQDITEHRRIAAPRTSSSASFRTNCATRSR